MINFSRIIERIILVAMALVVLGVISTTFLISYFNLLEQAMNSGMGDTLSIYWPICIDLSMVCGSLLLLWSAIMDESKAYGWGMLLIFVVVSTYFNIQNSPDDINSQLAHAVVPVALCLSTEALMILIHRYIKKQSENASPALVDQQSETIDQDTATTTPPNKTRNKNTSTDDRTTMVRDYFEQNPGSSITAAAKALGMGRSTVSGRLKAINVAAMVQQDSDAS